MDIPSTENAWHHICWKWSNTEGQYDFFHQGKRIKTDTAFQKGKTIEGNGIFLIGQEMDTLGGGFDSPQAYYGLVSHLNIWSKRLNSATLALMARGCSAFEGDVVYWSDFRNDVRGNVIVVKDSVCGYPSKLLFLLLLFSDKDSWLCRIVKFSIVRQQENCAV